MTDLEINNFSDICRICLGKSDLRSLFSSSAKKSGYVKKLSDLVMECTSIHISEDDYLPQKICQKCVYCVNQFYKFKEKAKISDLVLREQLRNDLQSSNDSKQQIEGTNRNNIESNDIKYDFDEDHIDNEDISVFVEPALKIEVEDCHHQITENKENNLGTALKEESSFFEDSNLQEIKTKRKKRLTVNKKINCKSKTIQADLLESNDQVKKVYKCDTCGIFVNNHSSLVQHLRTHTGEKPYPCDVCGKCFRRTEHLNTHKRIHTGERPYKCDTCNKSFTQKTTLVHHKRTHTGEKPEICTICGKCFSQTITLTYHMRTHTGETPFKCKLCNKGFTHAGNLNIHMRFHSGERPHECSFCHRRFFILSHLSLHLKHHRGQKDHVCSVCSKAFLRKEHLRDHVLTHTGARPHECAFCGKKYTQKSHLRRHLKVHQLNTDKFIKRESSS